MRIRIRTRLHLRMLWAQELGPWLFYRQSDPQAANVLHGSMSDVAECAYAIADVASVNKSLGVHSARLTWSGEFRYMQLGPGGHQIHTLQPWLASPCTIVSFIALMLALHHRGCNTTLVHPQSRMQQNLVHIVLQYCAQLCF